MERTANWQLARGMETCRPPNGNLLARTGNLHTVVGEICFPPTGNLFREQETCVLDRETWSVMWQLAAAPWAPPECFGF